jgi:hypothetical protein
MPWHAIQRTTLVTNTRTAVAVPTDGQGRTKVTIGNATADDLKIDMGTAANYIVIAAGGWHDYQWPPGKATPHGSADGVAFYATAVIGGTMILEWT